MKILSLSLLLLFISPALFGQTMDDTQLKQLQSGEYGLRTGQVQATFTDAVHPDSALKQIQQNGYKVISTDFETIMLSIEGELSDQQLAELKENKWVSLVINESQVLSEQQNVDAAILEKIKENNNIMPPGLTMIQLSMEAGEQAVNQLQNQFPDHPFKMIWSGSRSVVIETEPGKEVDVMDELKKLSVIENTAMIGQLREQH